MGSCGLYFRMRGKRAESRCCAQRGLQTALAVREIRKCLFSKHSLHLGLATGILGELTRQLMCLFWRWFWLEKRQSQAEGWVMWCRFDFANVVRRTWGTWGKRPELLRALNSRWGEGWGSAREWFSPWTSWNKKESQAWSVGTNSSYPRLCQDSGWEFLIQVMGWSQDRPLVSYCSVIVIHCSERQWRFFPIWTVLILPIKLLLVLKILRNRRNYFM